jgi:cell division protein FtsX
MLIANAGALGESFNCVAVAVHHTGKDAERGMRGSSALHGACDAEWQIKDTNGVRSATLVKMKDGEDGLTWNFNLGVKEVLVDEDGDPVTSCFVVPETSPQHAKTVSQKRKLTGQKALLLDAVKRATEDLLKTPQPQIISLPACLRRIGTV